MKLEGDILYYMSNIYLKLVAVSTLHDVQNSTRMVLKPYVQRYPEFYCPTSIMNDKSETSIIAILIKEIFWVF